MLTHQGPAQTPQGFAPTGARAAVAAMGARAAVAAMGPQSQPDTADEGRDGTPAVR